MRQARRPGCGPRIASVLDVEVIGRAAQAPAPAEIRRLAALAAASAGVEEGHVAIEF
ncbi:MAG: hypothetical protein QOG11_92, partial [Solirubrobacteraceae bacterium]|nr:hypothetical protein [Solirubrobacteraceae bacterium]